jgi:hypothetical protein
LANERVNTKCIKDINQCLSCSEMS